MKNKKKIISKRMDLIKKLVLAVFVLLFAFLVFNSISNILKSKSKVDDKKDVEKYLSSHYSYDEFTIGERKDYKVQSEYDTNCGFDGYSWEVESKKNGVKFAVYDFASWDFETKKCNYSINDSYESSILKALEEKEGLETADASFSFKIDLTGLDKETAANRVYEIVDKYNLRYFNSYVVLNIQVGNKLTELNLNDINSPEDILNNYL